MSIFRGELSLMLREVDELVRNAKTKWKSERIEDIEQFLREHSRLIFRVGSECLFVEKKLNQLNTTYFYPEYLSISGHTISQPKILDMIDEKINRKFKTLEDKINMIIEYLGVEQEFIPAILPTDGTPERFIFVKKSYKKVPK